MRAIDLFARVYDLPPALRNRLLSIGIPRVVPVAEGLGIDVVSLDEHHAETHMPFTRRSRNHVGSMYMATLVIQAEVTMATLLVGRCRPPDFRVLVKRTEVDFLARATGTVRAVIHADDDVAKLRALRDATGEAWLAVSTTSVDDGKPICSARFLVSVKHQSPTRGR